MMTKSILTMTKKKNVFLWRTVLLCGGISASFLLASCGSSRTAVTAVPQTPAPMQVQNDPTQPKMPAGEQVLVTFREDEARDVPG